MTSSSMSHVSMVQQISDNFLTHVDETLNTLISTIESCDHLPNQT